MLALLISVATRAPNAISARAADPSLVTTAEGALRGLVTDRYRSFRGIPYAAPPLKTRRFAPPAAVQPWEGTRDALEYEHKCAAIQSACLTASCSLSPPVT